MPKATAAIGSKICIAGLAAANAAGPGRRYQWADRYGEWSNVATSFIGIGVGLASSAKE